MVSPINELLTGRREELQTRLDVLNQERMQIERELLGISLYLDALKGVLPIAEPQPFSKSEPTRTRATSLPRVRKGERRSIILDILRQEPEGYTSGEICEKLGVTDSREQKAVYATLHNMKNKEEIARNPNKHFVIPPSGDETLGDKETEITDEPIEADAG